MRSLFPHTCEIKHWGCAATSCNFPENGSVLQFPQPLTGCAIYINWTPEDIFGIGYEACFYPPSDAASPQYLLIVQPQ